VIEQDSARGEDLPETQAYGISKAAGSSVANCFAGTGVFAASGILFNHESALRKPSFLSQKLCVGRCAHDVIPHLNSSLAT